MGKNVNIQAVKSGVWSMVCTFVQSAVSFLTMPVFTRMMSPDDYGIVTEFNSWQTILGTICTLCLYASINKAMFDYAEQINEYISSIMVFAVLSVFASFCIVTKYIHLGFSMKFMVIMFASILANTIFNMFTIWQRFQFKYKLVALFTIITVIVNMGLSLFLIIKMPEKKAEGRIIGENFFPIILGMSILAYSVLKGKKLFKLEYWKYGLMYGIPMIFHTIGMHILNQSDRIMISKMCGSYEAGVYSVPYSICNIIVILWSSVLSALSPWLYTKLHEKKYNEIYIVAEKIARIILIIVITFITFAPLAMKILADEKYSEGVHCMPAIAMGMYFMCIYSFFITFENFKRKPHLVAVFTVVAATLNIVLNYILIPIWGYAAASYTTMICYIVLALGHCVVSKCIDRQRIFPIQFFFGYGILLVIVGGILGSLYSLYIIRYTIFILILCIYCIGSKRDIGALLLLMKDAAANKYKGV